MTETINIPRPDLSLRIKERLHNKKELLKNPISGEAIIQLSKIQDQIGQGAAQEAIEKRIQKLPDMLQDHDKQMKDDQNKFILKKSFKWWFFTGTFLGPIMPGKGPADREQALIRESAKKWKRYLTKYSEGKQLVAQFNEEKDAAKIDQIVQSIIEGKPPAVGLKAFINISTVSPLRPSSSQQS